MFSNPVKLTINGYNDTAMEPCISPDDGLLFFNSSNAPGMNTGIFFATSTPGSHTVFDFQGPVGGVNSSSVDGTPSVDMTARLYFISPRSYQTDVETVYSGQFSAGSVPGVSKVLGISLKTPGWFTMDAAISVDGATMTFCDAQMINGVLQRSSIGMANKVSNNLFARMPSSQTILMSVNSTGLNYAPSMNVNGLELFFTRDINGAAVNMVATRPSVTSAFASPSYIAACSGYVEGPSISADARRLYYHKRNAAGGCDIWMVSR